ncbi:MAG: hypothetical protein JSV21_12045 [Nitrospirota bacterium]|nr:MAG: hypothetical protein JSV21_12045 [Nitrospirota bacterium]
MLATLRKIADSTTVNILLLILVLVVIYAVFSHPVKDPDLFWHLKTGEWIWDNKALPEKDPFSFTINPYTYEKFDRTQIVLQKYWLAQLVIYGFYGIAGLKGIIAFRVVLYLLIFLLLIIWLLKIDVPLFVSVLFLLPLFSAMAFYTGSRPNVISFFMAIVILFVLTELRGSRLYFLLPLIILLWQRMHGGYILGMIMLFIFFVKAAYDHFKKGEKGNKKELIVLGLSLAVPFADLSVIKIFLAIFETSGSHYSRTISESISPVTHMKLGTYTPITLLGIITVLNAIFIRRYKVEVKLIVLFVTALSFTAIRYIPFCALLSFPFIVRELYYSLKRYLDKELVRIILVPLTLIIYIYFIIGALSAARSFSGRVIMPTYPADAVEFIKDNNIKGDMFNFYDWGGYLIYGLYPDKKVFIDGRGLVLAVHNVYDAVIRGDKGRSIGGVPKWSAVLDTYNIEFVLIPPYTLTEYRFLWVVKRLVESTEWKLVYVSERSPALIFVRDSGKNDEIIKKYWVMDSLAYVKALNELTLVNQSRKSLRTDFDIAIINILFGRPGSALDIFKRAGSLRPELAEKEAIKDIIKRIEEADGSRVEITDVDIVNILLAAE